LLIFFLSAANRGLGLYVITTTGRAAACVDRACPDKHSKALLTTKIQNISKYGKECGKIIFQDKKLTRK
jgi:hypothetical protein